MGDFLSFRRMITPTVIQVLFWIGVVVAVVAGLVMIADRRPAGWLVLVVGPLVARIYCEVLILVFRISETLVDIRNELRKPRQPERPLALSETQPVPRA